MLLLIYGPHLAGNNIALRTENDLTIRQWRGEKAHEAAVACKRAGDVVHKPALSTEFTAGSADWRLRDIVLSVRTRRGRVSAQQPEDEVHKAATKCAAWVYKNHFSTL